jgi:hypothetical protein
MKPGLTKESPMAANETPNAQNISWNPPGHSDMLRRADGERYKTGTGVRGTYEWAVKDGLWHAYHYPSGTGTKITLVEPTPRAGKRTYRACVEHNKASL